MTTDLVRAHERFMRSAGYAESSIAVRAEHLRRLDRELPHGLEAAAAGELVNWHGRRGWAPATRAAYVDHTKAFYAWATGGPERHLDWDPSTGLRRPHVPQGDPRPVTDAELARALRVCTGAWWLAVVLAAYAGLRASEIARAERADITPDTITVRHGKGGKDALLPCHPAIWAAVDPHPGGRLVRSWLGHPITGRWFSQQSRGYFGRLGLPGVTLHRFRHWFATSMILAGADVRTVQTLMRHSSLATTARYIRITDPQRRRAVDGLPDLT